MYKFRVQILLAAFMVYILLQLFNLYMGYLVWNTGAITQAVILVVVLQTTLAWITQKSTKRFKYWCREEAQKTSSLNPL